MWLQIGAHSMISDALARTAQQVMIEAWLATLTSGAACTLRLFTSNVFPDPTTPVASLDEPVGDWYDPVAVDVGEIFEDPTTGQLGFRIPSVQFDWSVSDPPIDPETIYGYFVTNVAANSLYWAGR